ncbi:MAG: protein SCO1/2 [Janthinobacterium sp.]|jgi:protein SCO1/2
MGVKISNPDPGPDAGSNLLPTFAASLAALLAGLVVIFAATDGGSGFTTEVLRRTQVARAPQSIPDFTLQDDAGNSTALHQLLATDEKVWIVDFVYTRCQTICSSLGSIYQQLQQQIQERGLQHKVGLLSISFDPANDDAAALRDYASRMRLDPAVWRVVTLAGVQDRRRLLDAFGIMVVPAPLGEFEHNAALHIVSADGKLVRIVDYLVPSLALDAALAWQR